MACGVRAGADGEPPHPSTPASSAVTSRCTPQPGAALQRGAAIAAERVREGGGGVVVIISVGADVPVALIHVLDTGLGGVLVVVPGVRLRDARLALHTCDHRQCAGVRAGALRARG